MAFYIFVLVMVHVLLILGPTEGQTSQCPSGLPDTCKCEGKRLSCVAVGLTEMPPPDLMTGFTTIELDHNSIQFIPKLSYPSAVSLSISYNRIQNISDGAFSELTSLNHLYLVGNKLTKLRAKMFTGLGNLHSLSLASNQIKEINPHDLCPGRLQNLRELVLSSNHIESLNKKDTFGFKNLSKIYLSHNGFKTVPSNAFTFASSLKEMHLDHNDITHIPAEAFKLFSGLQLLNLDTTGLASLEDDTFVGLTQLTELDLGNNKLTDISSNVLRPLDKLQKLHLQNNQLSSLKWEAFPWIQLKEVRLGNNPWTCNCKVHWMNSAGLGHKDQENVTCTSPPEYNSQSLFNVTMLLRCKDKNRSGTLAIAIGIPILIICVLLLIFFIYRAMKTRQSDKRKSVRYSAVYRDTVESKHDPTKPRPVTNL